MGKECVYLKAAKIIDSGKARSDVSEHDHGACDVLGHPEFLNDSEAQDQFWDYFVCGDYFLMREVVTDPKECRKVRVLALLLMSEIAKDSK